MEAFRQTVIIPNDHKITISIPEYIKEEYAEITIIFKKEKDYNSNTENKKEVFISDKVKSISGILKTDKEYKELREEIVEERMQKYEDIL